MTTPSTYSKILKIHQAGYRQQHPCTCGPASLALVTQALGLEPNPESAWLAPEFARWIPLEQLTTKRGMALHEACLTTEVVYPEVIDVVLKRAYVENLAEFKQDLKDAGERDDLALVLNFTQDHVLQQPFQEQGSPHFSPVAGYDPASSRVLVADVDHELPEAYWVPIERLFEAMAQINPAFKTPRGWLLIRRRKL